MAAFVIRRFIGMIVVLVVVSFFVFLIFIVVPGGDPAIRIAGRTATDQNIENIRKDWGFDQPFYVQYYDMMKKAFTNDLYEQTHQGVSVVNQIKEGVPATSNFPDYAGPLTETVLLGNLSVWADGKKIEWDARRLRATNAPEVADIVRSHYQEGYRL